MEDVQLELQIPADVQPIDVALHTRFYERHLSVLPFPYIGQDTGRLPLLYFCLSSLDLLGTLDQVVDEDYKKSMVDWIYSLQVLPAKGSDDYSRCGFRGSPYLGLPFAPGCCPCEAAESEARASEAAEEKPQHPYDGGHIAMTYTAICCLKVLGDDLSRVNRKAVIGALRSLQCEDGSFSPTWQGGESDMRFVFSAAAISHMLEDWSGLDREATVQFIVSSQRYDGGIGLRPGSEGHGGSTYTAISALTMMGALDRLRDLDGLIRWCVRSQGAGFCGRPNKPPDACYSYWIGATMKLLGVYEMTYRPENRRFNLRCESPIGGFSKHPGIYADLLHANFGLAGLSLIGYDGLRPLNINLGLTARVAGFARLCPEAVKNREVVADIEKQLLESQEEEAKKA